MKGLLAMIQPSVNIRRIKLRHLHALVAVAQHGYIGRAAQSLAISQPALSRTLTELEQLLGHDLVHRSRRGLGLTEAGQTFLAYAGISLKAVREGAEKLGVPGAAAAPQIGVGLLPTVAATIFPDALQSWQASVASMRLHIETGSNVRLLSLLKAGELDLVVGRQAEPEEMLGLSYEHLYEEAMVLAVRPGHPLLDLGRSAIARLSDYCLILPREETTIRRSVDAYFVRHAIAPGTHVIESVADGMGRACVLRSDAVWFAPLGVVEHDLEEGMLRRLPVDTGTTARSVGMTLRSEAGGSPELSSLRQAIRGAAEQRRDRLAAD